MKYKIERVNINDIKQIKSDYYRNITAPIDDFWDEGLIPSCDFYTIKDKNICGFFALDKENVILLFYIKDDSNLEDVFKYILDEKQISRAYVSSYDPLFFKACKSVNAEFNDNTFLYIQDKKVKSNAPVNGMKFREADMSDFDKVIEYTEKINLGGEWLIPYYTRLINNKGLILFVLNEEIIGTGEIRPVINSKKHVNIGVTVSCDYRKKGVATYIINVIREISNIKGYKTICSTTIDNTGAQKTLAKCGYKCYHKIYTVSF